MTSFPENADNAAIAGGAINAQSESDAENSIIIPVGMSIGDAADRVKQSINYQLETLSDPRTSSKYIYDQTASYFANGTLSILPKVGKLVFTRSVNEPNNGLFRLDQENSHMFSNAKSTTLGSTEIDTVDGQIIHPLGTSLPSTPFTPQKTWLKQMFPINAIKNIAAITILELVQSALFKAVEATKKPDANVEDSDEIVIDLGLSIIENEEEFL